MKKITIKRVCEDIFYEKLENGLEVYLYSNKKFHSNYVTFTTKYGSVYNEFDGKGSKKLIRVPNGIAHFLEHKVFAQENDPQPEDFFANNGATCNAYTTFKNTTYLFSTVTNIEDNVKFLLDFVQNLYLTDDNVKSEKGIITQEINMCNDNPNDILYDHIRLNAICDNPFRESIIGTKEEVNSITKELLEKCYNNFYNPGNMFLVVTGNFDMDKIMDIIRNNQNKKKFDKFVKPRLREYKEPDEIVKTMEIINCNVTIPKIAYTIKMPINKFKLDVRKLSIYMYIIFNLLFGDTSDFDEEMKNRGLITGTLYYNLLNTDTHLLITLINTSDKYEELIKEIDKKLKNISFKEIDLDRKKKVLISNEIFGFENIEVINEMIIDNIIFDGRIEEDNVGIIESLNIKELNEIVKLIDFNNKSIVVLKK